MNENMKIEQTLLQVIKKYGRPFLKFKPSGKYKGFSEQDIREDVPKQIAVFQKDNISKIVVYEEKGNDEWIPSSRGERFVIRHLLNLTGEIQMTKEEFEKTIDVEVDELYRIAVRDKLKVKLAKVELDIEQDKVKELVNKNIFLKHLISEANSTFFIGKPKIEVPLNY